MTRNHKHFPVESTKAGAAVGGVRLHCPVEDRGKQCIREHMSAQCRCGATGVYCYGDQRWHWKVAK